MYLIHYFFTSMAGFSLWPFGGTQVLLIEGQYSIIFTVENNMHFFLIYIKFALSDSHTCIQLNWHIRFSPVSCLLLIYGKPWLGKFYFALLLEMIIGDLCFENYFWHHSHSSLFCNSVRLLLRKFPVIRQLYLLCHNFNMTWANFSLFTYLNVLFIFSLFLYFRWMTKPLLFCYILWI